MSTAATDTPDWEGSGKPQPKAAALRGSTSNSKAEEKPYVHVPGTVHLNAFVADVEEAKNKVAAAQAELAAANERLHQKKVESGMV